MNRAVSSPATLFINTSNCSTAAPKSPSGTSNVSCTTRSSTSPPSPSPSSSSTLSDASRTAAQCKRSNRRPKSSSAAGVESDSSDDDGDGDQPFNGRLGGCSSQVEVLDKRDDSNKENVAPLRSVGEAVLSAEAQDAENETIARRTRGRMSLTRMRRTSSSASIVTSASTTSSSRVSTRSGPSAASTGESHDSPICSLAKVLTKPTPRQRGPAAIPRTPSSRRRMTTGATVVCTPPSSRKRPRPALDASDRVTEASDSDCRTPDTPMSRLRLDTCSVMSGDDDRNSYFGSSQTSSSAAASSLFDEEVQSSRSDAFSRATTPCDSEMDTTLTPDHKDDVEGDNRAEHDYSNVYAHARALLRYNAGTSLDDASAPTKAGEGDTAVKVVGRDHERKALHAFLARRFDLPTESSDLASIEDLLDGNTDAGSLYICGLPGTGKTALIRDVVATQFSHLDDDHMRVAFVNCMSVQHPRQVFVKVMNALGETIKGASEAHIEAEAERRMDKLIHDGATKSGHQTLIVLDEIDHLLGSRAHQNVLYRLFAWASGESDTGATASGCALIGIANSLDLTERFIPLLASKGAAPALLHFRPFDSKEIVQVLKSRLTGLKCRYDGEEEDCLALTEEAKSAPTVLVPPLFAPAALELAARKISAATGDLRKALDAARLAIEAVEGEQRRQALANCTATGTGTNTEASKLLSHLTPSSAPKVTPQHILKVLTAVLGSPHLTKIRQLGLQPKLMLAAILIAHQRAAEGMPVLGSKGNQRSDQRNALMNGGVRLADIELTYAAMLRNDGGFTPLESSEVLEIFELLEVQGMLALSSDAGDHPQPTAERHPGPSTPSSSGVSPGGKRAAKKQLLASSRIVRLLHPTADVQKGITTVASAFAQSQPSSLASGSSVEADQGPIPSQGVTDAIKRMLQGEEDRIRKSRGWEQVARQRQAVRDEELGGGRLAHSASTTAAWA